MGLADREAVWPCSEPLFDQARASRNAKHDTLTTSVSGVLKSQLRIRRIRERSRREAGSGPHCTLSACICLLFEEGGSGLHCTLSGFPGTRTDYGRLGSFNGRPGFPGRSVRPAVRSRSGEIGRRYAGLRAAKGGQATLLPGQAIERQNRAACPPFVPPLISWAGILENLS